MENGADIERVSARCATLCRWVRSTSLHKPNSDQNHRNIHIKWCTSNQFIRSMQPLACFTDNNFVIFSISDFETLAKDTHCSPNTIARPTNILEPKLMIHAFDRWKDRDTKTAEKRMEFTSICAIFILVFTSVECLDRFRIYAVNTIQYFYDCYYIIIYCAFGGAIHLNAIIDRIERFSINGVFSQRKLHWIAIEFVAFKFSGVICGLSILYKKNDETRADFFYESI